MKKTRVIAAIAAVAVAAGAASHAFALDSQVQENGGSVAAVVNTAPNSEDDFDFTVNDDFTEITITGYHGTRKDVVIPASIQDVPVVRIGEKAFYNNDNITSVVIPEGVRDIEDGDKNESIGAFKSCRSLASVSLPKGIFIGNYAFYECGSLESVTLGEDTSIGNYAFSGCTALTSIVIPKGSRIYYNAFSECSSLQSVTLPEDLPFLPGRSFYNCKSLAQIQFPSTLKFIYGQDFVNCPLTSVNLPSSLKYIGGGAFKNCPVASVELPEGLEFLGGWAFDSGAITSVSLPKSLKWVVYARGDRYDSKLKPLIHGDNIESITIAQGCAPNIIVEYGSDGGLSTYKDDAVAGKLLITGAKIDKTIRLQKALADFKPAVCAVGECDFWTSNGADFSIGGQGHNGYDIYYYHLTDEGRTLLADLQRYGFSIGDAQSVVSDFCSWK